MINNASILLLVTSLFSIHIDCGSDDCGWFWELDPSDTVSEYQDASIHCQVEYMVSTHKCDSCLSEEHLEALEIKYLSRIILYPDAGDDSPYGRVMACLEDEVQKPGNRAHTLGSVFQECVVRETDIPFE